MRFFLRVSILMAMLVVLLLPGVAHAAGPYYTSTSPDGKASGTGTGVDPRLAETALELASACEWFRDEYGGTTPETVYWVLVSGGSYSYFEYTLDAAGVCTPKPGSKIRPGTPPGFGTTVPAPIIVGGLVVLGFLLLGAGWLLSRRLRRGTHPA